MLRVNIRHLQDLEWTLNWEMWQTFCSFCDVFTYAHLARISTQHCLKHFAARIEFLFLPFSSPPPFFFPAYYWFRLWFIYLFIFSLSVSDVPAVPLLYGAGDVHKAITSESSCILPSCEVCLSSVGLYCRLNAKPFFNDKNNCSLGKMLLSFTSSRN